MNRFVTALGWMALIVICLYFGRAALFAVWDVFDDLFYWTRWKLLPGLIWAAVIGAVIWVGWGLVSRNGRV